jgi:hypothetical protein
MKVTKTLFKKEVDITEQELLNLTVSFPDVADSIIKFLK